MNYERLVAEDGMKIKDIEQTEELCLVALISNPLALQYVKQPTHGMVLISALGDIDALQFVSSETPDSTVKQALLLKGY